MRRRLAFTLTTILLICEMHIFIYGQERNRIESRTYYEEIIEKKATVSNVLKKNTATTSTADKKEFATASDVMKTSDNERNMVYNVSFPTKVKAYLDPGNLSGKGEVFSDVYTIKNYGRGSVLIKIKNIKITCKGENYEFLDQRIEESDSTTKKININMIWKNQYENIERVLHISDKVIDEYVLSLKAAEYDDDNEYVELNEDSIGSFYFSGTLNANPNIVWESGEINLKFDYEVIDDKVKDDEIEDERDNSEDEFFNRKTKKNQIKIKKDKVEKYEEDFFNENVMDRENLNDSIEIGSLDSENKNKEADREIEMNKNKNHEILEKEEIENDNQFLKDKDEKENLNEKENKDEDENNKNQENDLKEEDVGEDKNKGDGNKNDEK